MDRPVQPAKPLSSGVLLVGCAALAVVIALELADDVALAPDVTAAPAVPELQLADARPFDPPSPDAFAVISERPLFAESRRPYVAPAVVEPAAGPAPVPAEPLTAELVGIMLTGRQQAVLIQQEGAGLQRVALGQSVDGWRVERIERNQAVLSRAGEEHVLELRPD